MNFKQYFTNVYETVFSLPDPERIRLSELRQAKLELMNSIKHAESAEVQAAAYRIQADTLRERIQWLQDGGK